MSNAVYRAVVHAAAVVGATAIALAAGTAPAHADTGQEWGFAGNGFMTGITYDATQPNSTATCTSEQQLRCLTAG